MSSMQHLLSTSWNGRVILLYCMFLFYKQIKIPRLGLRQLKPRLNVTEKRVLTQHAGKDTLIEKMYRFL